MKIHPLPSRFFRILSGHRNWTLYYTLTCGVVLSVVVLKTFSDISEKPLPILFIVIMVVLSFIGGAIVGEVNWWIWVRIVDKRMRRSYREPSRPPPRLP